MKKRPVWAIVLVIAIILIFIGILVYRVNLPPGCKQMGLFAMGGCFSKQNVENVEIVNPTDCLDIQISNCSVPRIAINNKCEVGYTIDGKEYGSSYNYLDLKQGEFSVEGEIDEKKFSISGYVTKPLCN